MCPRITSTGSFAIASGVGPAANSAGVTSLTFLSVVCADSSTAINNSNVLVWSSGTGVSG